MNRRASELDLALLLGTEEGLGFGKTCGATTKL